MNPDSSLAAGLALAALPIGISAVLNMGEAASVYADDIALRHMSASGDKKAAKMLRLLEKHPAVESSVSTVSALCLVLSVWGIARIWTLIAPDLAQSAGAAAGAALAGTFLFTVLGVIAPRRLAAYFPKISRLRCSARFRLHAPSSRLSSGWRTRFPRCLCALPAKTPTKSRATSPRKRSEC